MELFASQVCFRVTDINKSLKFYSETLGFEFLFTFNKDDGTPFMYYLRTGCKQYLELIPVSDKEVKNSAFHHITYLVDDVKKVATELLNKGLKIYSGPASLKNEVTEVEKLTCGKDGNTAFYISDPDGNNIEIMEFSKDCPQLKFEK